MPQRVSMPLPAGRASGNGFGLGDAATGLRGSMLPALTQRVAGGTRIQREAASCRMQASAP